MEEEFGILDGKRVPLDESIWDLPEKDRVRIVVMEVDEEGNAYETRPFRFVVTRGRSLDEETFLIE
jgi:hypothetical protein